MTTDEHSRAFSKALADAQELRDQGDDDAADAIIRDIAAPHLDAMCEAVPGLRDQLSEHFKVITGHNAGRVATTSVRPK